MNGEWNKKLIDGRQLMLLLFLGRMFSMMTYSPGKEAVPGSTALAAQLPALVVEIALLCPAILLVRRLGSKGVLESAYQKNSLLGHFCALAGFVFCLLQTARTLTVQTDFLTGTIYRLPNRLGLMLALWCGIVYAVWLGLESFSRLGTGVFLVFVLLAAALAIQAVPNIDPINLHHPLENGPKALVQGAAVAVSRCGELAAAVLLLPAVRDNAGRWTVRAALLWTAFTLLVSFLVLTVLGNFAATRSYPVYTLALAGGEQAVFGRLDALLLLIWIFLAVIRGGTFLWLAARSVFLMTGRTPFFCTGFAGVLSLAAAAASKQLGRGWEHPLLWGIALLGITLFLPLIIGLYPRRAGGKQS